MQIDIGNYFSVDDYEGVFRKQITRVVDRTAGSENFRLFDVRQLDAKFAALDAKLDACGAKLDVLLVHFDSMNS